LLPPAEYSVSHYALILEISQRNTLNARAHISDRKKRAGPANSHVGNNKKKQKPPPPPPPVRALQGLTLNIRGMTPAKWLSIQELPVFLSLDYNILTKHQLSAEFRPDEIIKSEIIKSGWDFHAVSSTAMTHP